MSDVQSVPSPNNNKIVGQGIGAFGGAGLATGIIALMTVKYPDFSPTGAAALAGVLAGILGSVGTYMAPLFTAIQHRAIKALDGGASPDQKLTESVAQAQKIVNAAQTFTSKGP